MAVSWKGSIPMLIWVLLFALLLWFKVEFMGYFAGILIGLGWFLLIPVLNEAGVAKTSAQWFQKAGIWAIFSSAFGLVAFTLLNSSGVWYSWIVDFGLLASGFFAVIGALVGFLKWN